MRERDQYAEAGHKHASAQHRWGKPVPGQGKARVCEVCGAKETPASTRTACDGLQNEAFRPTEHDYDPV